MGPNGHPMEFVVAPVETQSMLRRWRDGDATARDRLMEQLYPELERIAAARLRHEATSSLATSDLVNDAVLRLMATENLQIRDRAHLLALASRVMQHILVDHARAKMSGRRRHVKVELTTQAQRGPRIDLLALDAALIRLKVLDEALMDLVNMRYFGGMTIEDIAAVTGLSAPTVKRRWETARAWLADALAQPIPS